MQVPLTILMSGPIRPSPEDVLTVVLTLRAQLPNARIVLGTWSGSPIPNELREAVDLLVEVPEPTKEEIDAIVTTKTRQQRRMQPQLDGSTYTTYKMIYGVRTLCESVASTLSGDAIVMRIRTDTPFFFAPGALEREIARLENDYVIRWRKSDGPFFDDWFALTRFRILQETWTFDDYNASLDAAWNPEDLIHRNLRAPLRWFQQNDLECYILRPNGETNYHL